MSNFCVSNNVGDFFKKEKKMTRDREQMKKQERINKNGQIKDKNNRNKNQKK